MTHPLPFTTQNTARAALFRDEPENAALAIMRCNIHKKRVSEKSETLYPLSGRRGSNSRPSAWKADALSTELLPHFLWAKMDSNHRRYKPADLQSAPFGHSGIRPFFKCDAKIGRVFFKCKSLPYCLTLFHKIKVFHFPRFNCTFLHIYPILQSLTTLFRPSRLQTSFLHKNFRHVVFSIKSMISADFFVSL